jgi:hypothetical protein
MDPEPDLRHPQRQRQRDFWDEDLDAKADDLADDSLFYDYHGSFRVDKPRHEAWYPLVQFLASVRDLTDFAYTCPQPMPACVFNALQEHHPRVRWHISHFNLADYPDGDSQDRRANHGVDGKSLLRSPCLYSIRIFGPKTEEALVQLIQSGGTSQLRHIHNATTRSFFRSQDFQTAPHQPGPSPEVPTTPLAQLRTLLFTGYAYRPQAVVVWSTFVDFSNLRHFEYDCDVSKDLLQLFISNAVNSGKAWFRTLRSLGLTFGIWGSNYNSAEMDVLLDRFLSLLPPLESLSLQGHVGPLSMETILSRHGPTLRTLLLPTYSGKELPNCVDAQQVLNIARSCPRLQDIRVRVRRCHGGQKEAAVYRALGRIPLLRRAQVTLDCEDDYDQDLVNEQVEIPVPAEGVILLGPEAAEAVRRTVMNLAVDKELALAIWRAITENRTNQLEKLFVDTDVPVDEFFDELVQWGLWIGRSWVCKRVERLYNTGSSRAGVEIVVQERHRDPERPRESDELDRLVDNSNGVDVWQSIWPSKREEWWEDWHSCPLDIVEDVDE